MDVDPILLENSFWSVGMDRVGRIVLFIQAVNGDRADLHMPPGVAKEIAYELERFARSIEPSGAPR